MWPLPLQVPRLLSPWTPLSLRLPSVFLPTLVLVIWHLSLASFLRCWPVSPDRMDSREVLLVAELAPEELPAAAARVANIGVRPEQSESATAVKA